MHINPIDQKDDVEVLFKVRERIHSKAGEYFSFDSRRWEPRRWRMLFGATDALLDTHFALRNAAQGIPKDRRHALLFCYGFLQALYIQQDAVALIWRALDLVGDPLADPRVQGVRELRNRVAGHPARAERMGRDKRPSSAIINVHDVDPEKGFKAVVYYDGDMEEVHVSFAAQLAANASGLVGPLLEAERAMVTREAEFRKKESASPLSAEFNNGLSYTLEKLRCDPGDGRREMALRMLRSSVDTLEVKLKSRGFFSESAEYHIGAIRAGITLGEELDNLPGRQPAQQSWWVIGEGIGTHVNQLLQHVCAIDERLVDIPHETS